MLFCRRVRSLRLSTLFHSAQGLVPGPCRRAGGVSNPIRLRCGTARCEVHRRVGKQASVRDASAGGGDGAEAKRKSAVIAIRTLGAETLARRRTTGPTLNFSRGATATACAHSSHSPRASRHARPFVFADGLDLVAYAVVAIPPAPAVL